MKKTELFAWWLVAASALGASAAHAQPVRPPIVDERPQPLSAQRLTPLRALVIHVKGRAQWRSSDKAAWREAKVNDVLEAGALVRTGLRSMLGLRVGRNATILVHRSSRLALPTVLKEGETLVTRAALIRGRADFKVDQVGLRAVMKRKEANQIWEILRSGKRRGRRSGMAWSRQFREFQEKLRTGSNFEIAEVLRDLLRLQLEKELSFGERKQRRFRSAPEARAAHRHCVPRWDSQPELTIPTGPGAHSRNASRPTGCRSFHRRR